MFVLNIKGFRAVTQHYTSMDLLPVEYAVLLNRKSDIDRGEAKVNI
jgi:hypothetical protein